MDIEGFKNKLESLVNLGNAFSVLTFFGIETDEGLIAKKADIDDEARKKLGDNIKNTIKRQIDRINADGEFDLINLSDGEDQNNVIYKYDLPDGEPHFFSLLKEVDEPHEPSYFSGEKLFSFKNDNKFENISCFIHRIGSEDNHVTTYRQCWSFNVYKQATEKIIFIPTKSDTRIDSVNTDLLKMDFNIDVIRIYYYYYIINNNLLQNTSEFSSIIKARAEKAIEIINQKGILCSIKELQERLDELHFARRLMKVIDSSSVINIDKTKIIQFV